MLCYSIIYHIIICLVYVVVQLELLGLGAEEQAAVHLRDSKDEQLYNNNNNNKYTNTNTNNNTKTNHTNTTNNNTNKLYC